MNKTIRTLVGFSMGALFLTVASVLVVSSIFVQRGVEANRASSSIAPAAGGEAGGSAKESGFVLSAAEVATHATVTDCWMIIAGNVYNLTTFLPLHPGGQIIMAPYCGREGTAAFNTKDKKPGTKHTPTATSMLAQYFVGSLGQTITTVSNPLINTKADTSRQTGNQSLTSKLQKLASNIAGISPTPASGPSLTTATVALHATPNNCWIIIFGGVFDVSSYLTQHPGGIGVITPYCGHDATDGFATKGHNPGVSHSANAQAILSKYFIGNIGNTVGFQGAGTAATPTPTLAPGQLPTPTPTPLPVAQSGYSSATVASHGTSSNCWIIISNNVYNVTGYLVLHPGGVGAITPYCGKEATNAFATKGGGGSSHSSYAVSLLNSYRVGALQAGATSTPTPTLAPGQTATPTPVPTNVPTPTPTPTPLPQSSSGYTTADVSSHATSANCWIIISAKVYNVTSYLTRHPGGVNAITPYCGKEATNAFNTRGGTGSHSTTAKNLLNGYFIGNLVSATVPTPTSTPIPGQPTATPIPGQPTATPIPSTPTPTTAGSSNFCTRGVLPDSVSSKYPGATIKSQSIEDSCSQELEVNTASGCRHIKTNSSGSITSDQSC